VRTSGWTRSRRSVDPSRLRVAGNYDGGAGAAEFRQIAICGHAYGEARTFAANDRTIKVRLRESRLQTASAGAARMAGIAKFAGADSCGKRAGLFKRRGVENRGPRGNQVRKRLTRAGPIDAGLCCGAGRNANGADAASPWQRRQASHRAHQRLADGDHVGFLEKVPEALPVFFVGERVEIGTDRLVDIDA